jgi:membrane protease YdiL (CAAX protease family)
MSHATRASRILECVTLFLIVPSFYIAMPRLGLGAYQPGVFEVLGGAMAVCLLIFVWRRIPPRTDITPVPRAQDLKRVALVFLVLGIMIGACVAIAMPERLFNLPRARPGLWITIMILYPLVSVFPQEFLYRRFFFRRYEQALGGVWPTIAASAILFGYVHILFGEMISVAMTSVGGLLFAYTYHRTRSLLACSIEHALYGCFVFTIGLGSFFFYAGAPESDDRAMLDHVRTGTLAQATLGDGHARREHPDELLIGLPLEVALDRAASR